MPHRSVYRQLPIECYVIAAVLYADGQTADQVACQFGVSKDTIIGVIKTFASWIGLYSFSGYNRRRGTTDRLKMRERLIARNYMSELSPDRPLIRSRRMVEE